MFSHFKIGFNFISLLFLILALISSATSASINANSSDINETIDTSNNQSNSSLLPNGFVPIGVSKIAGQNQTKLESNKAYLNTELSNSLPSSVVKNNFTNFVQYDGKLVANSNHNNSEDRTGRASHAMVANGVSVTLILVLLFVITVIIGIILSALFVMRRRFSIWRINGGSRSNGLGCNDGANGVLTNASSSENASTIDNKENIENKEKEAINDVSNTGINIPADNNDKSLSEQCNLTSVENKQAIIGIGNCPETDLMTKADKGHSNEAAELCNASEEKKCENEIKEATSDSPSLFTNEESSKLLGNSVVNTIKSSGETNEINKNLLQNEQISSSSLIVNVLNELSESVVNKLAAKSPASKSTNNADPEKQPLKD